MKTEIFLICTLLALGAAVAVESALIATRAVHSRAARPSAVKESVQPRSKSQSGDNLDGQSEDSNEIASCSGGRELLTPRVARIETPLRCLFVLGSSLPSLPLATSANAAQPQGSFEIFEKTMRTYFPKALPTSVVSTKVRSVLASRQFTRTNTLYGTSISPDEINSKPKESLSTVLEEYLSKHGGIYVLGGIGGLQMQGVQGMKEFLSHCPRGGRVFLLFGPNVGISDNGTIGKIERLGQKRLSECCEPGLTTYDTIQAQIKVEKEQREATEMSPRTRQYNALDSQKEFILENLQQYVDTPEASRVSKTGTPAFITLQMYNLGRDMILEQLQACLSEEARREIIVEVVILGGVIVNRGQILGSIEPREDYFQPLLFQSFNGELDLDGKLEFTDLFEATFGGAPSFPDGFN